MMATVRSWSRAILMATTLISLAPRPLLAAEVELYRPRYRSAAELTEVADGLLGPNGAAIADASGTLVLTGTREALNQALAALRRLDVALQSYRIETRLTAEAALRRRGVAVQGWIQAGDLRIGRVGRSEPEFGVVFRSLGTEEDRGVATTVSVRDGASAEIWTGTLHPAEVRIHRDRGQDVRELEVLPLVEVRTGVRLRLRSLADGSVELDLAPVIEELGPGQEYRQTAVATRVKLRLGEGIVIASTEGLSSEVLSTPFVSYAMETDSRETLLWVRVSREGSDPPP
jgi:hypothetical protein